MLIGTAGHIDHGKTALIKRLTGRNTDRLPEEIKRGISIELGYAYVPVDSQAVLGFIDVPGHERFVHTMLAGATGIDFALLVVAADDGVMPQTDEHLDILMLLGVARGVVALTKIDAVTAERLKEVRAQIASRFAGTAALDWPVMPVSSLSGEGIEALKDHLLAESARAPRRHGQGRFRMAIDRSFTLVGVGTVVTGTVHAGSVAVADQLILAPTPHQSLLRSRVRSIHAQDRPSPTGVAGQRCALNLPEVERDAAGRGMWAQDAALTNLTERIDISLHLSAREVRALTANASVHLHHGTADVMARVGLLDVVRLEPGADALASLALDRPIAACVGDRVVLRDASAQRTIGGGVVLDAIALGASPGRGRRAPARLELLRCIRDCGPDQGIAALLAQRTIAVARLISLWNLSDDECEQLLQSIDARVAAGIAFSAPTWRQQRDRILQAVAQTHAREPELPGVEQQRLRRIVAPSSDADAFCAAVDELLAEGRLVRRGAFLATPSHRAELGRDQRVRWERIKPLLVDRRFEPPRVRDLARETGIAETEVRVLLKTVARVGDVALVAQDHFFMTSAVGELADIAASLVQEHGVARAADFRDRIGTGRKLAIQILEFFDRIGFTRRVRDEHLLRRENPWR